METTTITNHQAAQINRAEDFDLAAAQINRAEDFDLAAAPTAGRSCSSPASRKTRSLGRSPTPPARRSGATRA